MGKRNNIASTYKIKDSPKLKEIDVIKFLDDYLEKETKRFIKEIDTNFVDEFTQSENMLLGSTVRGLLIDFNQFYSLSNKPLKSKEIFIAISFLMTILFSDESNVKKAIVDKAKSDDKSFDKFIEFIYNTKYWGSDTWASFYLKESMNVLLLYFIKKEILAKLIIPFESLIEINLSLNSLWVFQNTDQLKNKLKSIYKDPSFLDSHEAFNTIVHSINFEKRIEDFTRKNTRIITWDEIQNKMKMNLLFWDKLFNRNNMKYAPNKKYPDELFELVNQDRMKGIKTYISILNRGKEFFPLNEKIDENYETIQRSYNNWLKKKK